MLGSMFYHHLISPDVHIYKQGLFLSGVTIMLSITIFATIVGDMLPVSDATPLIG